MQSVGHRVPTRMHRDYIRLFDVVGKIARHKAAGIFESTVAQAAQDAGLKVRKARTPGTLARITQAWPEAANDGPGLHLVKPLAGCFPQSAPDTRPFEPPNEAPMPGPAPQIGHLSHPVQPVPAR